MLMIALVAMLLVATGGPARGTQHRVSAGNGAAAAAPQTGRQVDVPAPVQHDQPSHLLDLASTPPSPDAAPLVTVGTSSADGQTPHVDASPVTPTGRAPPAP